MMTEKVLQSANCDNTFKRPFTYFVSYQIIFKNLQETLNLKVNDCNIFAPILLSFEYVYLIILILKVKTYTLQIVYIPLYNIMCMLYLC